MRVKRDSLGGHFQYREPVPELPHSNQELQLATEEGSVQSHPTSVRSNTDGSVRISPEPSNDQLLNNQNECTPPRLESMEAMSGLPTTHSFAFYPGENELIQFEEATVSIDSRPGSSNHASSSTGQLDQPNSTTFSDWDHSTFQSHVMSIIRIQKSSTAELLMKSWERFPLLRFIAPVTTRFRQLL
ncbi:hypothetical protein ACTFIW_000924 [Dictyostelium discoideum]